MNVDFTGREMAIDPPPAPLDIFGAKEIAAFLNVTRATLYVWRKSDNPPPLYRLGGGPRGTIASSRDLLARYMRKRELRGD